MFFWMAEWMSDTALWDAIMGYLHLAVQADY